jgi:hypothetical protein
VLGYQSVLISFNYDILVSESEILREFLDARRRVPSFYRAKEPLSPRLEPRTTFSGCVLLTVISSSREATLFLVPSLYRAYFLTYRTYLHRYSNTGNFSRCFDLCMLSSWSRGISMPSLVQVDLSVLEL